MLTLTSLTIWLRWEQAGSGGSGFAGSGETSFAGSSGSGFAGRGETGFAWSKLVVVECSLSPLTIWLRWEQWIWLRWEQAGSGGSGFAGRGESGFAGRGESGFAGSKLVAVDRASLVGGCYIMFMEE